MNNNQTQGAQGGKIKNEIQGRGLFYGVIAVATFIIMAVGATFAYFTATTESTNTSVQTGSTTLKLNYISYESGWMQNDLIPANSTVVEYSFEYQDDTTMKEGDTKPNALCKDDYGNSICSVYVFQVYNSARSPQSVSIDVVSEYNSFASLNAMAYEISLPEDDPESTDDDYDVYYTKENATDGTTVVNGVNDPVFRKDSQTDLAGIKVVDGAGALLDLRSEQNTDVTKTYSPIYINRKGVTKTLLQYKKSDTQIVPSIDINLITYTDILDSPLAEKDRKVGVADNIDIDGGKIKTFALVLYIKNADVDQTVTDASKSFTGKVIVGSGDGSEGGVSGSIGKLEVGKLQSQQTTTNEDEEVGA